MSSDSSSLERGILTIKQYVQTLPLSPGVYRMINIRGEVLYVGKAKNLKKRVISYTQPERLPIRLQRMVAETTRMEFVTTHTEVEALLLEVNLIKKLTPRYNILMRDSKSFAYIRITGDHPYPLLTKHRGARNLPGDYYGPFASGEAVNTTLTALHRAFLLRSCPDHVFASRKRPCLQYQIKRCSAPCVNYISYEDYQKLVQETRDFLSGKSSEIQKKLATSMEKASAAQDYERAAIFRDRIRALTAVQARQMINTRILKDADIFAITALGGKTCVQLFLFRNGSNYGAYSSFPSHGEDIPPEEVLEATIAQFYEDAPPPPEILINRSLPNVRLLEEALSQEAERRVHIRLPKSGAKAELVRHAFENAKESLERHLAEKASQEDLLRSFMEMFDLPTFPHRIEVYDNSHIQGTLAVGAMIVAGPEGFLKSAYRKFNIRSKELSPGDDYGMLREVLTRRFSNALAHDKDDTSQWPDVILIDGGKGQLSTAESTFADLGISDIQLIAIAKGPDRHAGRETFYVPGRKPFQLPPNNKVLYYLQRLRDEAHRFAVGAHRKRRLKAISRSKLDDVPGVGAARKRALLQHFGSAKAVEGAGLKDLEMVIGVSQNLAKKIYDYFHGKE
ncbi:MAG: excinuclease ABC subunit C [Alphaproteobacteria bacterium 41-28]|nr:MAG: excinuclease ABC subunit C [Alphaproteobacteria bacterium 41-28]